MGALFCKQQAGNKQPIQPAYDFYRCSYLRYMGFASVIASKMVPHTFAHIPQMAATAYIFSDVFNKTLASVENDDDPHRVIVTAVDAMLWQTMASVIAPLLLYGSLKSATKLVFLRSPKAPAIKQTKMKTSKDPCVKPPPPPPCGKPATPPPPPPSPCGKPATPPPSPPPPKKVLKKSAVPVGLQPVPAFVNILPGAICLMLMPFILRPIQDTVDDVMDETYRKWAESYLKRTELTVEERREREKARQLKAQQAAKEAEEKLKKAEQEKKERLKEAERLAAEKAKQLAKEEELAKARRLLEEKEAKARAKQKCLDEEKMRKEQAAAEERAIKEKLKQEETELNEKKARLEKELKEKAGLQKDCD